MSTYDDASLIYYPSGYKASKAYSLKPTDGSGDLTFTRASTATRVKESGLIEEVATGVPRIDFTGGGCGKLLLEPQRTNSLLQSNTFNTAWINQLGGGTITGGQINPLSASDDAWKLTKDAASGRSIRQAISLSSSTYSYSAFLKSGTLANAAMRVDTSSGARFMNLDLSIGTISSTSGTIVSTSIEDYGNGWYRCTMVVAESITNVHVYVGEFSGTIAGDIYCQRTQLEAGSYPTSYIPTTTTAVTRVADSASKSGISSLIGQTEGVLYAEMASLSNLVASNYLTLSDGSYNNRLSILFSTGTNVIRAFLRIGGAPQCDFNTSSYEITQMNKIAFKYKENDFALWVNGVEVATDVSGSTFSGSTLNIFSFSEIGTTAGALNANVQSVMVFPSALSDTDLAALTTL